MHQTTAAPSDSNRTVVVEICHATVAQVVSTKGIYRSRSGFISTYIEGNGHPPNRVSVCLTAPFVAERP